SPPVRRSLLSKSVGASPRRTLCSLLGDGALLAAKRRNSDPFRWSPQTCHRSADGKPDSIRSPALFSQPRDQAEDALAQQCWLKLHTQKQGSEEPCCRSCVLISWQTLCIRFVFLQPLMWTNRRKS